MGWVECTLELSWITLSSSLYESQFKTTSVNFNTVWRKKLNSSTRPGVLPSKWLRSSSCVRNTAEHPAWRHADFSSFAIFCELADTPPCTVSICPKRLSFAVKLFRQEGWGYLNGFSSVVRFQRKWAFSWHFKCFKRFPFWVKRLLHKLQAYGLSPVCARMWRSSSPWLRNDFEHFGH